MLKARELLIYLAVRFEGNWKDIYEFIVKKEKDYDDEDVQNCLNSVKSNVVTIMDKEYPSFLKQINMPPFVLFYCGDISIFQTYDNNIAFVGSRKNSDYGRKMTTKLVDELEEKYVIISGMAKGIDSIAHKAAINSNKKTVAVLGSGIEYCYPRENFDLYNLLKEKHLIISEYPGIVKPEADHFPIRNRIIAGLSKGVVVTEGKKKSGTHITVVRALECGREVFCVPTRADEDSLCNALIKEGARLIESVQDIYDEFNEIILN